MFVVPDIRMNGVIQVRRSLDGKVTDTYNVEAQIME
jgi:hypothetical protein